MGFRIGILVNMGSTKHCFKNDEGARSFQTWQLESKSLSSGQERIHVKRDVLVFKIGQELVSELM